MVSKREAARAMIFSEMAETKAALAETAKPTEKPTSKSVKPNKQNATVEKDKPKPKPVAVRRQAERLEGPVEPEIPEPLKHDIPGLERRRQGIRNNWKLKGLRLEAATIDDLESFAKVAQTDSSRLANFLLKLAMADETAPDDLRPYLDEMRRRR